MTDIPPDVRDRAAEAAYDAYLTAFYGPDSDSATERKLLDGTNPRVEAAWPAVVDAVAEVLAVPFQEAVRRNALNALNAATVVDVMAERDALKARVAELEDANAELRAHGPIQVDGATYQCGWERAYRRDVAVADGRLMDAEARVDLLTAALTEIAEDSRCDPGTTHYGPNCVSCIASTALTHDRYRSAAPTESEAP